MSDRHKELAARKAVEYIGDGMVVGLGTGSTAEFAIRALGERVKAEGLEIQCVPTSEASAALGEQVGLDIQSFEDNPVIDLTIDGADEVDPDLNLIKGLGGALLREKIVAAASTREIIIIDPGKLVDRLGT
ncbi:MAG: ribose 5-phosphate isomerase A, partial [Candidatus Latescibacterota bacterium]|nr:ribose 5-phosphate isomerase A [Candidatus Latescibacterota bacterium]